MPLSTGCEPIDALLDGGLEEDAITLVFGEGGSGKTNLALQCAREAAATGAKVAYVDTEGVSARRLQQVFSTVAEDAQDQLLFFQPFSISEQERMVEKTALLKDVGLVVVDSINMHYRLHIDGGDDAEREASRSLYRQLHHLTTHARKHGVPVLITGQVFGSEDATQPFARRVMEHLVKALVRFEKRPDGSRRATVLKHRSIEEGRQARFRIGPVGLEDADAPGGRPSGSTAAKDARGGPGADAGASEREAPGGRPSPGGSHGGTGTSPDDVDDPPGEPQRPHNDVGGPPDDAGSSRGDPEGSSDDVNGPPGDPERPSEDAKRPPGDAGRSSDESEPPQGEAGGSPEDARPLEQETMAGDAPMPSDRPSHEDLATAGEAPPEGVSDESGDQPTDEHASGFIRAARMDEAPGGQQARRGRS